VIALTAVQPWCRTEKGLQMRVIVLRPKGASFTADTSDPRGWFFTLHV